jgi:hypothetical protein
MRNLQDQVVADEEVKRIFESRKPDGWLGKNFHGENSIESDIRWLSEKGVSNQHPIIQDALISLESHSERLSLGIGKVGFILDQLNMGGSILIQAVIFAYVYHEDRPFVQKQVDNALNAFNAVINVDSIESIIKEKSGRKIFSPGVIWPSLYHLRLLAWTGHWRTTENMLMLSESIRKLISFSPIPAIKVLYKSQIIAPASFCMDQFAPDMGKMKDFEWMKWFHRMELLARLGVIHLIPALENQIWTLCKILDENDGFFGLKINHPYFRKKNVYTGLMLEKDWNSPQRRIYDLTFRSLLILN